jgi:pyruvate/2-oxoglutarate/acetoin dehydrogenase E1 component
MNAPTNFASEILRATQDEMSRNSKIMMLGLGVTDPKGVFGTTSNLSKTFGVERVIETPTSENAMTGVGVGLAISGNPTILVHQRLDFFLLAMDQLVNSAAKWNYMYGGEQSVPLTIRLILGRGWGQGPTHSQNLHSWFAHVPGLKILMPSFTEDVYPMLTSAIRDPNPVIFLEDRWLHGQIGTPDNSSENVIPFGVAKVARIGKDISIISSGYTTLLALKAANFLSYHGINAEVIDLRSIKPLDKDLILKSVAKCRQFIVVDSGNEFSGFANEIVKMVVTSEFASLISAPKVIAARDTPEPASYGVISDFKFDAYEIVKSAFDMVKKILPPDAKEILTPLKADVPDENFKGPF